MPGLVLASSTPPDPTVATDVYPMQHWWTPGNADETWDLTSGQSGIALQGGVRGLTMPKFTRYTQNSPAVAGTRWRGFNTDEREVFWPLAVFSSLGAQAWLDHDRHFWAGLRPDVVGTWAVTQPSGEVRSLPIRFTEDTEDALDIAPEIFGWQVYGLAFVAESPFWTGDTVTRNYGLGDDTLSFFGTSGGPPFYLAPAQTTATATVDNPGDVPAWPVWRLTGPFDFASVGAGGLNIEIPFGVGAGATLTLDTDPTSRVLIYSADDTVLDMTDRLGAVAFGQVPPGGQVDLNISITGTGSVSIDLTPNYFRAW